MQHSVKGSPPNELPGLMHLAMPANNLALGVMWPGHDKHPYQRVEVGACAYARFRLAT